MSEEQTRQSEGSSQAGAVTVSDIQELIRRKEEIEAQIKANYDVLESVSVGSGFPGGRGGSRGLSIGHADPRGLGGPGGLRLSSQLCLSPWAAQGAATAVAVGRWQIALATEKNLRCWCLA